MVASFDEFRVVKNECGLVGSPYLAISCIVFTVCELVCCML